MSEPKHETRIVHGKGSYTESGEDFTSALNSAVSELIKAIQQSQPTQTDN